MSSSKTIRKRTSTISSSSSSSTQPPKQHFFASSSSTSSQSIPITEVHSTYNYNAHKQRRQKRTKEDGRWFQTPRPRYNSDGKKLKQGSSYPYPSGGNRLPFVKMDGEDGGVVGEEEEVEVVWGRGKDHGRGESRGRDATTGSEMNKVKDKGKGKEKAEERGRVGGTRAESHDNRLDHPKIGTMQQGRSTSPPNRSKEITGISPPNRGSKRDTTPESTMADQALTRREPSQEIRSHENDHESQHRQQERSHGCLFAQDWQQHDEQADIEYARSIEYLVEEHPLFARPTFGTNSSASHWAMFSPSDSEDPFARRASLSPNFQHETHTYGFGMRTAQVQPQIPTTGLFPNSDQHDYVPLTETQVMYTLSSLVEMSMRYSPWSELNVAPVDDFPAALSGYHNFVAGLKRTTLRFPNLLARCGANEQNLNDLDAEHARLIRELSVLKELQGPLVRFLEATRMQYWDAQSDFSIMAMEEYNRLKTYRRLLLERLGEVQCEMGNFAGMDEGLDMDHLSLAEDDEHFRPFKSGEPQCHWHQRFHFDQHDSPADFQGNEDTEDEKAVRREARLQLEEYNERWESILTRAPNAPSSSTALARAISIPYPVLPSTASSPSPSTPSTTQAWTTHTFFCHAFNLAPYLEPPQPNSPLSPPRLAFYASGSRESQLRVLMGLRRQLKIEKVRWHEDRLRAVFGDAAAKEERAKGVWGVVVDLKRGVDEALEGLERG
ncbi:hypothetical protein DL98DRAFT_590916 [Cadophora sp. DSE1049]|nr:hypothetical protein DL98DRAFT_590916 [Cadophora sp. DSE1049]